MSSQLYKQYHYETNSDAVSTTEETRHKQFDLYNYILRQSNVFLGVKDDTCSPHQNI